MNVNLLYAMNSSGLTAGTLVDSNNTDLVAGNQIELHLL